MTGSIVLEPSSQKLSRQGSRVLRLRCASSICKQQQALSRFCMWSLRLCRPKSSSSSTEISVGVLGLPSGIHSEISFALKHLRSLVGNLIQAGFISDLNRRSCYYRFPSHPTWQPPDYVSSSCLQSDGPTPRTRSSTSMGHFAGT